MMSLRSTILVFFLLLAASVAGCGGGDSTGGQAAGGSTAGMSSGEQIFVQYCVVCHQANGMGVEGLYPPVSQTPWTLGDKGRLIRLVLNGMNGPVEVMGVEYNNAMTPGAFLTDQQIADVLTYTRSNFGNNASPVTAEEVAAVRAANTKVGLWQAAELEQMTGIPGME